jgi:hypothetical protein
MHPSDSDLCIGSLGDINPIGSPNQMHEHLSYISIRVLPVNFSEDMCLLDEAGHGVVVDPHS